MSNIFTSPEDFSTSWSTAGFASAINVNQTAAPDGTSTADRLIDDGGGGAGQAGVGVNAAVANTTTHSYSVFAKADQLSIISLGVASFTTPANGNAWFDLSTGAIGTVSGVFDDSGMEAFSDDWYRVWVVFTSGTDPVGACRIWACQSDNSLTITRDGTSSIFIWGAYLNAGSEPETYVSQAGITVTSSAPRLIRGVTRNITRNVTKNLIDF